MIEYFKLLDFVLPQIDMSRIVGGQAIEGYGESFLSYDIVDNEYFHSIYSKKIKFKILPDVVNYTEITRDGAPPHVDLVKSAINYYVEPAGCVTCFWQPRDKTYVPKKIPQVYPDGSTHPLDVYEKQHMQLVARFSAKDNQAFALSTTHIHSVTKPDYHTTRKFFRWTWRDLTFEELLENIEIISVDK